MRLFGFQESYRGVADQIRAVEEKVPFFSQKDESRNKAVEDLTKKGDRISHPPEESFSSGSLAQPFYLKKRVGAAAFLALSLALISFYPSTISSSPLHQEVAPYIAKTRNFGSETSGASSRIAVQSELLSQCPTALLAGPIDVRNGTQRSEEKGDVPLSSRPKAIENHPTQKRVFEMSGSRLGVNQIGTASLNLVLLGGLQLAGTALQTSTPFFCLIGLNRLYKVARLTGASWIHSVGVQYEEPFRRAEALFDKMEASFPISISQLLENMKNIDRWAVAGLLKHLPKIPGITQRGGGLPGSFLLKKAWPLIEYAPFFLHAQKRDQNIQVEGEIQALPNGTTPKEEPIKDLVSAGYLILAGQALSQAAPFLALSATHQVYTILKEAEKTEALKKKLPLFSNLIEKTSKIGESIERALPFSTEDFILGLTDIDRWAMMGFMNLIRPRIFHIGGAVPGLSFLLSDRAWRCMQFAPLVVGSGLSSLNAAIGLNPQLL